MDTVRLKLVTIVCETILEEKITRELLELGSTGFTVTASHGRGSRGIRSGEIPGESVRVETLVSEAVADAIVTRMSRRYFPNYAVVAWLSDVQVVRGEKYVG